MKTLLQIAGLSRSGSTLLGQMLGSHSEALYLGEIPAPIKKGRPVACADCGPNECPVWGPVLGPDFVSDALTCQIAWSAGDLKASGSALVNPGDFFGKVFRDLREFNLLVDSSKKMDWYDWNSRSTEYQTKVIHLLRDLRGVVCSQSQTGLSRFSEICGKVKKNHSRLERWLKNLDQERIYRIHYEELVLQPEKTLERVCRFLGLPFEPTMMGYYRFPSHVFGGNRGPLVHSRMARGLDVDRLSKEARTANLDHYLGTPPGLALDTRWIAELEETRAELFQVSLGSLNSRIGYTWNGRTQPPYRAELQAWGART